ncbi:tetratricopeptide repeat protein [Actinosynnema sp. NPDC023794]
MAEDSGGGALPTGGVVGSAVHGPVAGSVVQTGQVHGGVHVHVESSPASDRQPPRELPADTPFFVGRTEHLARPVDARARSPWVISGMAGIGKTALAVRWAHHLTADYPDGCLFLDLHGHTPGVGPVKPGAALDRLLQALGVARERLPVRTADKSALYRSLLAGTRTVVVLDNAAGADQVRPLLPGTPGCLVLVTSRRHLASLDDGLAVPLEALREEDGLDLLRRICGAERVDGDRGAARRIVELCSGLPLAIRICAARLRARPSWTLAALADRLARQTGDLAELDDGERSVAAAFTMSYRELTDEQRRVFRLLAAHPGADFDGYAAAALTGRTLDRAQQACESLVDAHLLVEPAADRYRFHDLVRRFGGHLTAVHGTPRDRRAALVALFDHYRHTAAVAMDRMSPDEKRHRPAVPPADSPRPPLPDAATGRAWLDAERGNLVEVCRRATALGLPHHAVDLAATLYRYLDVHCHLADAVVVHMCAHNAARSVEDRHAEAEAWTRLGTTQWQRGCFGDAAEAGTRALELFRALGDHAGQGRVLNSLAITLWRQGRYRQAEQRSREALETHRAVGDRAGTARALGNLALVHWRRGRLDRAVHRNRQALALYLELDDLRGQARALGNIGNVRCRQGHHGEAVAHHHQALGLYTAVGDRAGEADALANLGVAFQHQGLHRQAVDHHHRALALFREIGDLNGEARAHNGLGEHLLTTAAPVRAHAEHRLALDLARYTGDRHEQARAHHGLARACRALGDGTSARHHELRAVEAAAE